MRHPLQWAAPLAGAGFGLMVSPCCTPMLALVVTSASLASTPVKTIGILLSYGVGHAAPLTLLPFVGRLRPWILSQRLGQGVESSARRR